MPGVPWDEPYTVEVHTPQRTVRYGQSFRRLMGYYAAGRAFTQQEQHKFKDWEEEEVGVRLANDFLVGCDPEFVVLNKDGRVRNTEGIIPKEGPVGWDHGGRVVEFRPTPSKGTYTLIKNLRKLVHSDVLEKLRRYHWRSGAYVQYDGGAEALGGHVHLDIAPPNKYANADSVERLIQKLEGQSRRLTNLKARRVSVITEYGAHVYEEKLDLQARQRRRSVEELREAKAQLKVPNPVTGLDAVMRRLEALDILPKAECEARRKYSGYGKYGLFRESKKGNSELKDHLEYRTFPSWLYSPRVAFLVLTLSKLAAVAPELAHDVLVGTNAFRKIPEFVEKFKGKDDNALRLCESVLPDGHKALKAEPDADLQKVWEEPLDF